MSYDRRRFIQLTGSMAAGGIAGCLGNDDTTGTSDADTDGNDGGAGSQAASAYDWQAATWDAYWYSLYNMSTNISMSGNGVLFPHNEQQQQAFNQRVPAMLEHGDVEQPPVVNPNLNMAPFTRGDPEFQEQPVLDTGDGRPDASTLAWDKSESSGVVSPASVAWTHLKGVTWAKNFQNHFDILPENMAPRFRSQMLTTLAQLGVKATLVDGGPDGNGALTRDPDENMLLISGFRPGDGSTADPEPRANQHAAMLWFLSDLMSLVDGEWYGYVNPEPLIPQDNLRMLTDGVAQTTMNAFPPGDIVESGSTRDLGLMLAAVGWYGTHAGSEELRSSAGSYADSLASEVRNSMEGNGRVGRGAQNQAATQAVVAQGLLWASEIEGVHQRSVAEDVVGYMLDELWDEDAGTFMSGENDTTYRIRARDAGDVTGGLNAADAVLDLDVKETFARYFDETFNRGRLQRAERAPSRDTEAEHTLPLPAEAGGEYGEAAVYNTEVEYDAESDRWSVTDDGFDTEQALYLANQDIWISQWGGRFFQGRGVPGQNDTPE